MYRKLSALALVLGAVSAQQACTLTPETQPSLSWSRCSAGGSCSNVAASVVLDSNWRWTHQVGNSDNCYEGNTWDTTVCPDNASCAANCCLDGADYEGTYGIKTSGDALSLQYVTKHEHGTNVGSRVYLMESQDKYQMFNLLGNEFTFDVDSSQLGCGLNGALYFVSMDQDGGLAKHAGNQAGARYGTGYCDAQCPRDIKFISGQANVEGWNPSDSDPNGGVGNVGTCCAEMDIWEANSFATAYTPHPCDINEAHTCQGNSCGGTYSDDRYGGSCDPDGCDFNTARQGNETFYGPGLTIDSTKKVTVVTQFHTDSSGGLSDITRFYVQDGVVFANANSEIPGNPGNSINKEFCDAQKAAFGDTDTYNRHGGGAKMGEALDDGMVLVLSLWDDAYASMRWLDSTYPETSTAPGAYRGPCPTDGGVPEVIRGETPGATVVFSNIKFGPIGSTFNAEGGSNPNPTSSAGPSSTSTATNPGNTGSPQWGQCGGNDWTGPKSCVAPFTCTFVNEWYSQCL